MTINLARDGAELCKSALLPSELDMLKNLSRKHCGEGPGVRISQDPMLSQLLANGGAMDAIAAENLGPGRRPVRAVLFDKTTSNNWALGWHQDRTIAVQAKVETPGFGPWTRKAGILHVTPPFPVIEKMLSLRAHLDPCGKENAPLLIAPSSHRMGRIASEQAAPTAKQLGAYACLAEPSDVWIYATAILHASNATMSSASRRVLQADYANTDLPNGLRWLGL